MVPGGLIGIAAVALLVTSPATQSPLPERVSVDAAVAEALTQNHDLQAERARLPAAEAKRRTAGVRPNPVVSGSTDHLDLAGMRFTEDNGGGPSEYSLRTDYLWEQGGKRARRMEVADHERSTTRHEVVERTRLVVFEVQSAFVDLLLAQQTMALANDNATALRRIVEVSTERVRSGDLAEVELMRTRVALAQLENEVSQKELARRTAQRHLVYLLGRPTDRYDIEAVGDFRLPAAASPSISELEARALASRPDMLGLIADQARAEADLRLQQSMARVDFTVGAEFRRQQGVNGRASSLGFFVSTPLPLFDRNQGEVDRARAEAVGAARRADGRRASIASEVRDAHDRMDTARALVERIGRDMMRDAREVWTITEYAYRRGEATLVELLDAQRAFNDTMQSDLDGKSELARSQYLLDAVCGKGDIR